MVRIRAEWRASVQTRDLALAVRMSFTVGGRSKLRRDRLADNLRAEIEGYRTPAERADLYAALERYADEETEEIRSVLTDQSMRRVVSPLLGPLR